MSVQSSGAYLSQLATKAAWPLVTGKLTKFVEEVADAGYLYPIESIACSIIFGLIGSIFGGMILAPITYILSSVLVMAPFCRAPIIFKERVYQDWNDPCENIEQRKGRVLAFGGTTSYKNQQQVISRMRLVMRKGFKNWAQKARGNLSTEGTRSPVPHRAPPVPPRKPKKKKDRCTIM